VNHKVNYESVNYKVMFVFES